MVSTDDPNLMFHLHNIMRFKVLTPIGLGTKSANIPAWCEDVFKKRYDAERRKPRSNLLAAGLFFVTVK